MGCVGQLRWATSADKAWFQPGAEPTPYLFEPLEVVRVGDALVPVQRSEVVHHVPLVNVDGHQSLHLRDKQIEAAVTQRVHARVHTDYGEATLAELRLAGLRRRLFRHLFRKTRVRVEDLSG